MKNNDGTVDIKGSKYKLVAQRVKEFREAHPNYGKLTHVIFHDESRVMIQVDITDEEGRVIGSGVPEERRDASQINKTSATENCDTSAYGRALASIGYAGNDAYASADELVMALAQQSSDSVNNLCKAVIAAYQGDPMGFCDWVEGLEEADRENYYRSGRQGEKTKFKESWDGLYRQGCELLDEYEIRIANYCRNDDALGFIQLWDQELTPNQKSKMNARLSAEHKAIARRFIETSVFAEDNDDG